MGGRLVHQKIMSNHPILEEIHLNDYWTFMNTKYK